MLEPRVEYKISLGGKFEDLPKTKAGLAVRGRVWPNYYGSFVLSGLCDRTRAKGPYIEAPAPADGPVVVDGLQRRQLYESTLQRLGIRSAIKYASIPTLFSIFRLHS